MVIENRLPRRGGRLVAAGACVLLGIGLAGCGAAGQNEAAHTPGASAAVGGATASADPTGGAAGASSPSAKASKSALPQGVSTARPKDPLAPATVRPVIRNGKTPRLSVRVKGGAQPFDRPITYTDGLNLRITKMTQGKVTGQGPGVFPGRAVTDFYVTLTNHTKRTLDLGVVVLTVTYGSPARLAHLVYNQNSRDFSGPIGPGKSGHAVYGFSIPARDLGHVTMTVDLDGIHQLAVFTGRAS